MPDYRSGVAIDPDLSAVAACDDRGVPRVGRDREMEALRKAGYRDLVFGRIYEGHLDALQLIARYGSPGQRARARDEAGAGALFGVWNTQDGEGVHIAARGNAFVLRGAKTWCSGAGTVARAVVTAQRPGGESQMCIVPMERVPAAIDGTAWHPLGMQGSDSYRVGFDDVVLEASDLLGDPGDYETAPWFLGGAMRFVAVQTGGIQRLADETTSYLLNLRRDGDSLQTVRVAEMHVALRSARNWLDLGAQAWADFDTEPSSGNKDRVTIVADMARAAIERHALDVIERAQRCVGARGLLEPLPLAALVRDLLMYLRQPAPDAALLRVGTAAFAAMTARRNASSATATGTSG